MRKDYQELGIELIYLIEDDVVRTSSQFVEGNEGEDDNAKAWEDLFE